MQVKVQKVRQIICSLETSLGRKLQGLPKVDSCPCFKPEKASLGAGVSSNKP